VNGFAKIRSSYKEIHAEKIAGSVTVEGESCPVLLNTVGGDIDISNEYKYVILKGTSGSIKVRGNSSPIEITDIKNLPENGVIDLYTTYKPVTLELPSNTNAQIAAKSEYGKIQSDFPVYVLDNNIVSYDSKKGGPKIFVETTADIQIYKRR